MSIRAVLARLSERARFTLWVASAIGGIFATGLLAGRLLERFDESIGFQREADRIGALLRLEPGMSVGDVRAGTGKWTADLARRIGSEGQVYATAGPDPAHEIYATLAEAGVDNVTVITRTPGEQGRLPVGCCDSILVRAVYHHFEDPARILASLGQALRPDGRLVIIDFDEGTEEASSGHGIGLETLIREVTAAGFEAEEIIENWEGNAYCVVFRPRNVVSFADEPAMLVVDGASFPPTVRFGPSRQTPPGGFVGRWWFGAGIRF